MVSWPWWKSVIFTFHPATISLGIMDVSRMTIRRLKCRWSNAWPARVFAAIAFLITRKITKAKSHFSRSKSSMSFVGRLKFRIVRPRLVRRNVMTRDVDLNELIGQDFEVQGVRFHGTGECRPCYWMDRAIAPGAEEFLKGRGGLRARILTDGELRSTARVPERAG